MKTLATHIIIPSRSKWSTACRVVVVPRRLYSFQDGYGRRYRSTRLLSRGSPRRHLTLPATTEYGAFRKRHTQYSVRFTDLSASFWSGETLPEQRGTRRQAYWRLGGRFSLSHFLG